MMINDVITEISNWWNSIYLDREMLVDQSEILFVLVILSFSIITTKIWIDERNITRAQIK